MASSTFPTCPCHAPTHGPHAPSARRRAQRTSRVEKWDVVMWNDQVHSSQEHSTEAEHCPSSWSASESTRTCATQALGASFPTSGQSTPNNTPCFATTASAFDLGNTQSRPQPIPRRRSSHVPLLDSTQTRLDALSALHQSVREHDESFLARMRELEQRCHLLPDSLSVPHAEDLSGVSRRRKRDVASWDEDGDVEMNCWNERRRKHRLPQSESSFLLGLSGAPCDDSKVYALHSSDDEYIVATHEGSDSNGSSDEEEEDDLDIVIISGGNSVPSLDSGSTSPSLSTSLSSLPPRSDTQQLPNMHNYTPLSRISGTAKGVDDLTTAMAGGAGSVVEWSTSPDIFIDESHFINADIVQAGALWA